MKKEKTMESKHTYIIEGEIVREFTDTILIGYEDDIKVIKKDYKEYKKELEDDYTLEEYIEEYSNDYLDLDYVYLDTELEDDIHEWYENYLKKKIK